MRISDWSSDVCSSDLPSLLRLGHAKLYLRVTPRKLPFIIFFGKFLHLWDAACQRKNATCATLSCCGRSGGLRLVEPQRSEEHTSELQSLMRISYAVFCLTKKKQTHNQDDNKLSAQLYAYYI